MKTLNLKIKKKAADKDTVSLKTNKKEGEGYRDNDLSKHKQRSILKTPNNNSNKNRSNFRVINFFARISAKTTWYCLQSNVFWWISFFLLSFSAIFFWRDTFVSKTRNYFSINKINFDGNEKVSDILLLKFSKLRYKNSSLEASLKDVKERLEKLSWIKAVIVQRKLPNKILVRISERTPVAILQTQKKLHLIDSAGVVLDNDGIGDYNNLPIVAGEGAEKEAFEFLRSLEKFPKIRKQLVFAVRVGRRRWNIKINKGILVKLPERGLLQAFGILDELSDSKGNFKDGITCLDLRLPDRIIISRASAN